MSVLNKLRLKPFEVFDSGFDKNGLKKAAVKGSMALMISQGSSFGLSLLNTIVLARLLSPSDFGIVGMVTVFINFMVLFKDAGLSTATIQQDTISRDLISNLFWFNCLISIGLGVVIILSSPLVATFYNEPELTLVTSAISISFIVQGLTIQHNALLQRHLKFTSIAIVDIIAHVSSLVVAIVMAYGGYRYWAIIGGGIARAFTMLFLTIYVCPWVPGKLVRGTGVKKMMMFGGHITGSYIVGYIARNLDKVLIGKVIGAAALGVYTRAFTLLTQPLAQIRGPLTTLSMPVMCNLKNDPDRYRNYFRQLLDISISLTLPITIYCFLESEFLINTLLGPKWQDAIPIFKVLSIGGIFVAISGAPGLVMLSQGLSKRYMNLTFVTISITSVAFLVGVNFGATGVAGAYSAASFLNMIPLIYFGFKDTPVRVRLVLESIAGPLFAGLIAGILGYLSMELKFNNENLGHIFTAVIFFAIYAFFTLLRRKTRITLIAIKNSVFAN
ncbi:lipopolysaccharide biosynthesis protein [Saccharicrinis sp. 156]|uniref:lipopolysaccharide biosynthesis protein n=1 Tax=Saccharicrinis sp. 156 TaxID=3417574 RepID=UPI003D345295